MKNGIIGALVVAVIVLGYAFFNADSTGDSTDSSGPSTQEISEAKPGEKVVSSNAKSLANTGLQTVPTSLFEDTSIKELDLSGNALIGALPSELGKLKNLEVLDASDNNLTGIPAEIGQLPKLRIVSFANNDISGLPNEIGNMSNLETLDLRGNPNVSTHDLDLIQIKIPNAKILVD